MAWEKGNMDGMSDDLYKRYRFVAMWTVINEGHNQVRLHNHNNFLAIVNGQTIVIHVVSIFVCFP